ncbi:hypothetical protein R6Q59_022534 [Mikania micrantha]
MMLLGSEFIKLHVFFMIFKCHVLFDVFLLPFSSLGLSFKCSTYLFIGLVISFNAHKLIFLSKYGSFCFLITIPLLHHLEIAVFMTICFHLDFKEVIFILYNHVLNECKKLKMFYFTC